MIGKRGEEEGMSKNTGPLGGVEFDLLEVVPWWRWHPIERSQAGIQKQIVSGKKIAVVRALTPRHVINKQFQGTPEIRDQHWIETWIGFFVFGEVFGLLHLQPVGEKIVQLSAAPGIVHHAGGVGLELFRSLEFTPLGGICQGLVRQGIPKSQGEPGGGGGIVRFMPGFRIEKARRF